MRTRDLPWFCCALLGGGLAVAVAQEEPDMGPPPHPPPPHEMDGMEPGHRPRPDRPLERFMHQLQDRHPEEFERLRHMRETNPREFRSHLRNRRNQLRKMQIVEFLGEQPRFREAVEQMSPEEREQVANRFAEAFRQDRGPRPPKPDFVNNEIGRFEAGLHDLAREYQAAGDDEKPEIKQRIRSQLEIVFDLQEEQRRRHVEEAEKRLHRLQTMLNQRAENRDEVIDRKVLELTDGDPLKW